jgi:methylthioribose-1-phosphate isomerase
MPIDNIPRTIYWGEDEKDGRPAVFLIDQTRLPMQGDVLSCNTAEGVCLAIGRLAVRGAPALGVAAALALALWTENETDGIETVDDYLQGLAEVAEAVTSVRPTAINLGWGAARITLLAQENATLPLKELKELVVQEALNMQAEDEERNRKIGRFGADLLPDNAKVLTHCNAGSLATAYFGTALGVIFTAHDEGKIEHVWIDETRPVNQGGRLTAWELSLAGVPSALIADSTAASIMRQGWVDAVIVGADHICANGDTANKIGTFGLAIIAAEHDVPFYVAAPSSTIDLMISSGDQIPIEQRSASELEGFGVAGSLTPVTAEEKSALRSLTEHSGWEVPFTRGHQMMIHRKGDEYTFDAWFKTTPTGVQVYNPAFDITPGSYITAFITETGVIYPDPDFETAIAFAAMSTDSIHAIGIRREMADMAASEGVIEIPEDLE